MKTIPCPPAGRPAPSQRNLAKLSVRLAEAEGTLRAIRTGEVDAVVTDGDDGLQVFSLDGVGHAYRVLIESMNEGALIVTADQTILYANQCFARFVNCPLAQVIEGSLRRFLSVRDRATLRPLLRRTANRNAKVQLLLKVEGGVERPVQISARPLPGQDPHRWTLGLVVTEMTEVRHNELVLRSLTRRVVQAQEAERGRVALELHGHITQLLCAVLMRSQALADRLSAHEGTAKDEAVKLRELLGHAALEVERISRNLRPSVLDELGLVAVVRDTCTEFAVRTGLALELTCGKLTGRLPPDTELTLYRVMQEALKNVEQHAGACQVAVRLDQRGRAVRLKIKDDGIGFDPKKNYPTTPNGKGGLGLLSMRERASYVGGVLQIKSNPRSGTEIEVTIPSPPQG